MHNHAQLMHALARARTQAEHSAAIHHASPMAAKKTVQMLLSAARDHGIAPRKRLAKAQLKLLEHPASNHKDFTNAMQNMHGDGLGSFLAGIAKGLLGPVIGIGKAIFGHPATKHVAKEAASHLIAKATAAAQAKMAKK